MKRSQANGSFVKEKKCTVCLVKMRGRFVWYCHNIYVILLCKEEILICHYICIILLYFHEQDNQLYTKIKCDNVHN